MTAFNHVLPLLLAALLLPGSRFQPDHHARPIRIGMLIPEEGFREPVDAVRLAIERSNAEGGWRGHLLELVVRTTEGPWGAGSKESVALVYEDSVVAMLISLDGRNAHLAEQVAAKSHLICLSTYATDPTLTQAYVPWFLRVVPSDDQQSMAILEHIRGKGDPSAATGTGVIAVDQNDSRLAAESLGRIAARMGLEKPMVFLADKPSAAGELTRWISQHGIRHLVVTAHDDRILQMLRGVPPDMVLYGTHMFTSGLDPAMIGREPYSRMILVSADVLAGISADRFSQEFNRRFGYAPRLTAYYAHDAAGLLLEGIDVFGADRESLKLRLPGIRYTGGITGPISFDDLGNRHNAVRLSVVRDGRPVRLE